MSGANVQPDRRASVIAVLASEPLDRVQRMIDGVACNSDAVGEIVLATPPEDARAIRTGVDARGLALVLIDNPTAERSVGLNLAAARASCPYIVRVDARSQLPSGYVERCIAYLADHDDVGVVGGVQAPRSVRRGVRDRGIARALANPYALGAPAYRRGAAGAVDTVYLGAFRASDIRRIGGWNEGLQANEDYELCERARAEGLEVHLLPGLVVPYEPRSSLAGIWQQYHAFGRSKAVVWRRTGSRPARRQVLALSLPSLAGLLYVASGRHRPPFRAVVCASLVGLCALDQFGAPPEPNLAVRAVAVVSYPLIWAAWVTGVAAGMLGQDP